MSTEIACPTAVWAAFASSIVSLFLSFSARRISVAYVFSNFCSNVWLFSGKLWEARSRLYRRQIMQGLVNTRSNALDEIFKIYTYASTHFCTAPQKKSAKVRQTFSHFCSFVFKISLIFCDSGPKFTNFHDFFRNFNNLYGQDQMFRDSQINYLLRFRNEYFWNFQKMIFEKLDNKS